MLRAILTLLFYLTLHTLTHAQTNPSVSDCQNIIGTLRNLDTDEIIPNAKIALENQGKIVAEVVSDNEGNYTFKNMEYGSYLLKATCYDFDYVYLQQLDIADCETQYIDLDFDLSYIITLEPVLFIGYKTPLIRPDICTQGPRIISVDCSLYTLEKNFDKDILPRALPGPAKKDPDKPIKELSIYPNPSFGQIKIELTFETLQLTLFDMLGHHLGTIPFQSINDELVSIDLSQLPAGTYALQLQHEEGTDVQKVVILND